MQKDGHKNQGVVKQSKSSYVFSEYGYACQKVNTTSFICSSHQGEWGHEVQTSSIQGVPELTPLSPRFYAGYVS